MKATINDEGMLLVIAENSIETYALEAWTIKNLSPCTGQFICERPYYAMQMLPYVKKKITLFHRIWLKIQLFLYR